MRDPLFFEQADSHVADEGLTQTLLKQEHEPGVLHDVLDGGPLMLVRSPGKELYEFLRCRALLKNLRHFLDRVDAFDSLRCSPNPLVSVQKTSKGYDALGIRIPEAVGHTTRSSDRHAPLYVEHAVLRVEKNLTLWIVV